MCIIFFLFHNYAAKLLNKIEKTDRSARFESDKMWKI